MWRGKMRRVFVNYKLLVVLLLGLFLVACEVAPTVDMGKLSKNPEDMKIAKIKPPTYVVKKQKPRIVVLPFEDNTNVSNCNLGKIATDTVHNVLASAGSYRVVERSKAKAIARELGFQESHGVDWDKIEQKYFALGKNINYAVVGTVTAADYEINRGKVPGVTAKVILNVRIIDLRKGEVVQAFEVSGDVYKSGTTMLNCGMFQEAVKEAVTCPLLVKLRETIPQFGYIREIRTYPMKDNKVAKVLFINLGSSDGLKPGDKVKIIRLERSRDPVTGKVSFRYVEIGEGVVAKNGLMPNESMVLVNDPAVIPKLRVGYLVRPTAAKVEARCAAGAFGEGFMKFLDSLSK